MKTTLNDFDFFGRNLSLGLKNELLFSKIRRNKYIEFNQNKIPCFDKLNFDKDCILVPLLDYDDVLYMMKDILAEFGVLVFETQGVASDEFNGCSYYFNKLPFILLNGNNSYGKRISSLIKSIDYLQLKKTKLFKTDEVLELDEFFIEKFFKYNGYPYTNVMLDAYVKKELSHEDIIRNLRMPLSEIRKYI
ncbi:MAG: hypothetical protein HUK28_05870 [Methanobrevibacter sp.]|nr:hypothetical protein [Methanobrevibacter sp.]